jgi:hypothetical protein
VSTTLPAGLNNPRKGDDTRSKAKAIAVTENTNFFVTFNFFFSPFFYYFLHLIIFNGLF